MQSHGDALIALCGQATREIVLVSPFIKASALKRIIGSIAESCSVKCVTRWRPEDIVAGVCDIEIYEVLLQRHNTQLLIHPMLHAKYFRADDGCLVGSANLTNRALGWAVPSNVELMVELPADTPQLRDFERALFTTTFEADSDFRDQLAQQVEEYRSKVTATTPDSVPESEEDDEVANDKWLPLCTRPELLYQIYSGSNTGSIITWTLESGQKDIQALRIPSGFSYPVFKKYIVATLNQTPIMQYIYEMARTPISPERGSEIITENFENDQLQYTSEEHWKYLKSWILFFLSNMYRQPTGSDDLQRGTRIGEISV